MPNHFLSPPIGVFFYVKVEPDWLSEGRNGSSGAPDDTPTTLFLQPLESLVSIYIHTHLHIQCASEILMDEGH